MSVFSPLARSVMDRFGEAVILFDPDGRLSYANRAGERILGQLGDPDGEAIRTDTLLQRLGRMGGRIERLQAGHVVLGHAVYLTPSPGQDTLADQERRAIVETLNATGWRLTETSRRLGISRTTLWRRLREYGLSKGGEEPEEEDGAPD